MYAAQDLLMSFEEPPSFAVCQWRAPAHSLTALLAPHVHANYLSRGADALKQSALLDELLDAGLLPAAAALPLPDGRAVLLLSAPSHAVALLLPAAEPSSIARAFVVPLSLEWAAEGDTVTCAGAVEGVLLVSSSGGRVAAYIPATLWQAGNGACAPVAIFDTLPAAVVAIASSHVRFMGAGGSGGGATVRTEALWLTLATGEVVSTPWSGIDCSIAAVVLTPSPATSIDDANTLPAPPPAPLHLCLECVRWSLGAHTAQSAVECTNPSWSPLFVADWEPSARFANALPLTARVIGVGVVGAREGYDTAGGGGDGVGGNGGGGGAMTASASTASSRHVVLVLGGVGPACASYHAHATPPAASLTSLAAVLAGHVAGSLRSSIASLSGYVSPALASGLAAGLTRVGAGGFLAGWSSWVSAHPAGAGGATRGALHGRDAFGDGDDGAGAGVGSGDKDDDAPPPWHAAPPRPLSAEFSVSDGDRRIVALLADPTGRLLLVADARGRVALLDAAELLVLRLWKGYRDCQLGWLYSGGGGARRALCAVLYAPRRGMVEAWRTRLGPRVASQRVGRCARLIYAAGGAAPVDAGGGAGRVLLVGGLPPPRCFLLRRDGEALACSELRAP